MAVERLANVVLMIGSFVSLAVLRVSLGGKEQTLIGEAKLHEASFVRLVVWIIQQDNPMRKDQLSRIRAHVATHHLENTSRFREVWLLHNYSRVGAPPAGIETVC